MSRCPTFYSNSNSPVEIYFRAVHPAAEHLPQCQQHHNWFRIRNHWNCRLIIGLSLNRAIKTKVKIKAPNRVKTVLRVRLGIYRWVIRYMYRTHSYMQTFISSLIFHPWNKTEMSILWIKNFLFLKVYRLPLYPQANDASHGLIVSYATKEKKQKSKLNYLKLNDNVK